MLRQAGAGRLLAREVVRSLVAVSHGQSRAFRVQIRRLLHDPDQFRNRNLSQHIPGALRLAHIATQQTGICLAHVRKRLTRKKVDYVILFQARVRLSPSQDWYVQHGWFSNSIDADDSAGSELAKRPDAAHAIPRILLIGRFSLAFVSLEEPWNERLPGQCGQSNAPGLSVVHDFVGIIEGNHFDDRSRLRRVVADLVTDLRP